MWDLIVPSLCFLDCDKHSQELKISLFSQVDLCLVFHHMDTELIDISAQRPVHQEPQDRAGHRKDRVSGALRLRWDSKSVLLFLAAFWIVLFELSCPSVLCPRQESYL